MLLCEWQFYYGQHLSDTEMRCLPAKDVHFIRNPRNWKGYKINGRELPGLGIATYYHRIILKPGERNALHAYGMRLGMVCTAYRLLVNGRLIGEVGKASVHKGDFVAVNCPSSFYFTAPSDTIDVVLQVSNFFDPDYAGVLQTVYFGGKKTIERLTLQKLVFATCVLCTIFLLFFYQMITSVPNKFKQVNLLISLLSFSLLVKTLNDGQLVLYHFFPDMGYIFHYKIWLISVLLITPFVFRIVKITFFSEVNSLIEKCVYAISIASVFFVLTANIDLVLSQRRMIIYAAFTTMAYLLYVLIKATMLHRKDAFIHVFSFFVMFLFFVNDLVFGINQKTSGYLSQLGILQYLLIQTGMIIRTHSRYQKQTIVLSQELQVTNQTLQKVNQSLECIVEERTFDLKNTNVELSKVSRQKDFLISTISHDLINSFNILLNLTKYLSDEMDIPAKYRDMMMNLYHTSDSSYRILDNTLQWAKLQMMHQPEMDTITILSSIINENVCQNADVLKRKNLTVEVAVDDSLVFFCNEGHLNTILRNLLTNAIKFSRAGGTIRFCNRVEDGWVRIMVQDDGMGMSGEQCQSLFDSSAYVKRRGTDGEVGAGIGLLIVKGLIEANQGAIFCSSVEKEGTEFTINFKIYESKKDDLNC